MQQILCFGELLLRLSPETGWPGQGNMSSYVGGAELNVAMALAGWQLPAAVGTALPQNPVSDLVRNYLKSAQVSTDYILTKEGRIGTYYLTPGADLKSAGVVYDRAYSSFALLQSKDIDFDRYLNNTRHLHLTAISPAVSSSAAALCLELVKAAAHRQIPVSLDLNYRSKLWQYGKSPIDIMPEIAQYADFIMGNIWAAGQMLGIRPAPKADQTMDPEPLAAFAKDSAERVIKAFPNCKKVGYTFRFNAPENEAAVRYFGALYQEGTLFCSPQKDYSGITDRAGSGDCFMAGLLYGQYAGLTGQDKVDFATAAATGKFYENGDHTKQSLQMVEKRMQSLKSS